MHSVLMDETEMFSSLLGQSEEKKRDSLRTSEPLQWPLLT